MRNKSFIKSENDGKDEDLVEQREILTKSSEESKD